MAASLLDTTRNLVSICAPIFALHPADSARQSLYTIPAAWILSIAPHFYAASLGKFDNKNPRTYTRDTEGDQSIDKGALRAPL